MNEDEDETFTSKDWLDALATMRQEIEHAIVETADQTGLVRGAMTTQLLKNRIMSRLCDPAINWALYIVAARSIERRKGTG